MNAYLLAFLINMVGYTVSGFYNDDRVTETIASRNHSLTHKYRRRRHVVFPEGSTFNVAFCFNRGALIDNTGPNVLTTGIYFTLAYELTHEAQQEDADSDPHKSLRRQKRNLYRRVEGLLSSAALDGRQCMLRTLCEVAQIIPPRQGVLQELIRIVFTYEMENNTDVTNRLDKVYGGADSVGRSDNNCSDHYDCPLSLLGLLLQFVEAPR